MPSRLNTTRSFSSHEERLCRPNLSLSIVVSLPEDEDDSGCVPTPAVPLVELFVFVIVFVIVGLALLLLLVDTIVGICDDGVAVGERVGDRLGRMLGAALVNTPPVPVLLAIDGSCVGCIPTVVDGVWVGAADVKGVIVGVAVVV